MGNQDADLICSELSLLRRQQGEIFDLLIKDWPSREDWLRKILSNRLKFQYRGKNFYYAPDQNPSRLPDSWVAWVGR